MNLPRGDAAPGSGSPVPRGGGRLAVRCIVVDPQHTLAPGEVVWDAGGRIVQLRRARRAQADLCLLPGLVDAHVHLQLEPLRGRTPPRAFVPWVEAVMAAQRGALPLQLPLGWRHLQSEQTRADQFASLQIFVELLELSLHMGGSVDMVLWHLPRA